jgi:hypothetical protein
MWMQFAVNLPISNCRTVAVNVQLVVDDEASCRFATRPL